MKFIILIAVLVSCAFGQGRGPVTISMNPERPEANQEFELLFNVEKRSHPQTQFAPSLNGLPQGTLLSQDQKDTYLQGFFNRTLVKQYSFKLKFKESGNYPVEIKWQFGGKVNLVAKIDIPIARNLDESALSVYTTGAPDTLYHGQQFKFHIVYNAYDNLLSGPSLDKVDWGLEFLGNFSEEELRWQKSKNPKYRKQLRQTAYLAPLQSGELSIPSMAFKYMKRGRPQEKVVEKKFGNSSFTSRTITSEPIEETAYTQKKSIFVKELPTENKPVYFENMVGEYHWAVVQESQELQDGEPLKLMVTVEGNGKPGLIAEPEWELPNVWNKGDAEVTRKTFERSGLLWTRKTWTYYLYPTRSGELELGELKFAYFDPKQKKYQELSHVFEPIPVSGVIETPTPTAQSESQVDTSNALVLKSWEGLDLERGGFPYLNLLKVLSGLTVLMALVMVLAPVLMPQLRTRGWKQRKRLLKSIKKLERNLIYDPEFETQLNEYYSIVIKREVVTQSRDMVYGLIPGLSEDEVEKLKHFDDCWNELHYSQHNQGQEALLLALKDLKTIIKRISHA